MPRAAYGLRSTGAAQCAGTPAMATPDEVIEVPARKVTACAFGGPGLDELFITTSREGLAADDDPLAGALFRVIPGARGEPVREFPG